MAKDIFTSSIEIDELSKKILKLLTNKFNGIINIGTVENHFLTDIKNLKKLPLSKI